MNDLLLGLQEKIIESNNQYRDILFNTKTSIENRSTVLVGGLVTLSNYESDFNELTTTVKETLSDTIIKVLESYCVKDLRNVEDVNEQFIKKINDKLSKVELDTTDEKIKFVDSLKKLLFEKYLEIINIKRIPFFQENKDNIEIEKIVNNFTNSLAETNLYNDEKLSALFFEYKEDIYKTIKNDLDSLNKLYINNFITEIEFALTQDVSKEQVSNNFQNNRKEMSFEEEIMPTREVTPLPEVEQIQELIPEKMVMPEPVPEIIPEIVPEPVPEIVTEPMEEPFIPEPKQEEKQIVRQDTKIDEIFELTKPKSFENINRASFNSQMKEEVELNEDELVKAMIVRLNKRLDKVNGREKEIEEEKERLAEDQKFLAELVENTDKKAVSLEEKEEILRKKDIELKEKEETLNEKLNSIMPFAKAVLKTEE